MSGSSSGPLAATAQIEEVTRSTGITSIVPSGIPGKSLSNPLAYEIITGSAIRKPLIQPGKGLASADSIIEGLTILIGIDRDVSRRAISPSAFVYAYASGNPNECARERPASAIRSSTQRERNCSVFDARAGTPAAPNSERASLRNSLNRSGVRLAVSVSFLVRLAASTSIFQSTSTKNGLASTGSSGAAPLLLPAT